MPLPGLDISSYQGAVDWAAVAGAGYSFAIAKASEGVGWEDPFFGQNWAAIKAEGLVRGAYHFGRPENDPLLDARYFCGVIGSVGSGDMLALDIEQSPFPGDLSGWARTWLDEVRRETGLFPFWYSYPSFIDSHFLSPLFSSPYPAWLVNPRSDWPLYMLQLLNGQYVPGINGVVDIDDFGGSRDDLIRLSLNGLPQQQGGFLVALSDAQQQELYDRLIGQPSDGAVNLIKKVEGIYARLGDGHVDHGLDPNGYATLSADEQNIYALVVALKDEVDKLGPAAPIDLSELNAKLDALGKHLGIGQP